MAHYQCDATYINKGGIKHGKKRFNYMLTFGETNMVPPNSDIELKKKTIYPLIYSN